MGEPGHRGRHKMRPPTASYGVSKVIGKVVPIEEEPVAENEEPVADPEMAEWHAAGERGDLVDEEPVPPREALAAVKGWTPDEEDFISLKGKLYLPARRRIQWMREEHKDWTIDTNTEQFDRGKRTGPGRIEDGFAVVRATVFDGDGRLISTGVKSEYSENFADFLEKAETGAIARALAVAGYGTESALDLDEGVDKERIADAPVERKPRMGPSSVPGVGRGGRTDGSSVAQLKRVSALSRELNLGAIGLAGVIEQLLDVDIPEMPEDELGQNQVIATFLSQRTSAEVGKIIESLEAAAK